MSDSPIDRARIAAKRAELASMEAARAAALRERARLAAEGAAAARRGASAEQLAGLGERLKEAAARAEALRGDLRAGIDLVGHLGDLDLAVFDPVAALEGGVPVALMPARLETRYVDTPAGFELRIRIFPDGLTIDEHDPEPGAGEIEAARHYWMTRLAPGGDAAAAWKALAGRYGAPRAAYLARLLQPADTAPLAAGAVPAFPAVEPRASPAARPPRAVMLPSRWVAIGMAGNRELFRKWGAFVPDVLPLGLATDEEAEDEVDDGAPSPEREDLPVDPALKWLVDYEAALAMGMAITVGGADVPGGQVPLAIDRLLVLGVDWTISPEDGAKAMAARLDEAAASSGLGFVAQGTPTNNGADPPAGAGWGERLQAALDPTRPIPAAGDNAASRRLSVALGLGEGGARLDALPDAELADTATARALIESLWSATGGYYLDQMWDPKVTDAMVRSARRFAVDWLRPGGPLPLLRAGRQPFGILPVLAAGRWAPSGGDGMAVHVHRLAQQLRPYFQAGLPDVPRLGQGRDIDDTLLALLQQQPWADSLGYRKAYGPETAMNTQGLDHVAVFQSGMFMSLIYWGHLVGQGGPPRISGFAVDPKGRELRIPFTADPARGIAFIGEILQALRGGASGRAVLEAATDRGPLLEMMLAVAALRELDQAGSWRLHEHLLANGAITAIPDRVALRTREQSFVEVAPAVADALVIQTPREMMAARIPALTGDATLADHVAVSLNDAILRDVPVDWIGGAARTARALEALAARPPDEIDRCFRGVLDAHSHRIDAWFTALATERLAALRQARPAGLHIGGWGIVEDLRRESAPDSLGHMLAPSLSHAVTAAVLESGRLAHADEADAERFAVDLGTRRTRLARGLLEGVANGQQLGALLGYRFERRLRELSLPLARFILPLRKAFPLKGEAGQGEAVPDTAAESIAARDVVDGVALVEAWRGRRESVLAAIAGESPGADEIALGEQALAELDDALDAVGDVLTAEAVHQMVLGNLDRSGAALAALDRQTAAQPLDVTRSPRSGRGWMNRVLAVSDRAEPAAPWSGLRDARARAEPRLDAWLGDRLGDPLRFVISVALSEEGAVEASERIAVPLAELGLSALSLVWLSRPGGSAQPSELEERIAAHVAALRPDAAPTTTLSIEPAAPPGVEAFGFGALKGALDMLFTLVSGTRHAEARDLSPPSALSGPGIDLAELEGRARALGASLREASAALAPAGSDARALRKALLAVADLGVPEAIPAGDMAGQREAVSLLLAQRVAALDAAEAAPAPEEASAAVEAAIARIRLVLGGGFPVLPAFRLADPAEIAAALADRAAATRGDPFAPHAWLAQVAAVRPGSAALADALDAAALLGTGDAADMLGLAQLPHRPGAAWVGFDGAADTEAALLLAGPFDPSAVLAGLAIDAWNDAVPGKVENAAVAFHYDAPGARAPQSLLLAVPPDAGMARWSLDVLRDTVIEAADLARLRSLDPSRIRVLTGNMLPALFVPEDLSGREPSIRFSRIAAEAVLSNVSSTVLGR